MRENSIRRTALTERLHAGLHRKLTLVSAPAGFGKSTLIGEWVEELQMEADGEIGRQYRVAWPGLDDHDDELVRFLTYL